MKVDAAVLRDAAGPYAIEPVDLAEPGPGQVLVRVVGAGMCHTDVVPRAGLDLVAPPIITGHEGAGVVEAVGEGVTSVAVGDHVVHVVRLVRRVPPCRAGNPAYCDDVHRPQPVGPQHRRQRRRHRRRRASTCSALVRPVVVRHPRHRHRPQRRRRRPRPAAGAARPARLRRPDRRRLDPRRDGRAAGHEHRRVRHGRRRAVGGDGGQGRRGERRSSPSTCTTTGSTAPPSSAPRTRIRGDADDLADADPSITGGGADYTFDTTGVPP